MSRVRPLSVLLTMLVVAFVLPALPAGATGITDYTTTAATQLATPRPDLTLSIEFYSPGRASCGTTTCVVMNVTYVVKNVGNATSAATQVRTPTTEYQISWIRPGEHAWVQESAVLAPGVCTTFTGYADPHNTVLEQTENNNSFLSTVCG